MKTKTAVTILALLVLAGCSPKIEPTQQNQAPKQAYPWTHMNFKNNPENFQFAIVSDRTGHNRPGVFEKAIDKLNLLQPEFVLCVGDLIEGNTEDQAELDRQWDEFDALVKKLEMPFFYLPGNHDINNEAMMETYRRRLGRDYYDFMYKNVLFLCINTEDYGRRSIRDDQARYFAKVLADSRNVRWTCVFMHEPLWQRGPVENWERLERLMSERPYTVFAGHKHRYSKELVNNRDYYILATTGAKEELAGLEKCQFDHIMWVTMTDKGPIITNLLLEGILTDEPCPAP
jgi:3',5'-cyclic AMP phosphodiesterase CpdA